jgi:hypothetical protein
MKPAIAIALLGVLGIAPAYAGKPQLSLAAKKPLKKPNCGESFDLAPRHAALPAEAEHVAKKLLTDGQVATVVKAKLADVQYCWNRLPAGQRKTDATAVLRLAIDATGEVETVDVGGLVSQEAQRCIAVAAAKWQFPVADELGEFEYAVALRAM